MIFKTFAQRKRMQSRSAEEDVYVYDKAPAHLRHQISMTFSEAIGRYDEPSLYSVNELPNANDIWRDIDRICRKEIQSYLSCVQERDLRERFSTFLKSALEMDDFLSGVELACCALSAIASKHDNLKGRGALQKAALAIEEINARFIQHGVGFQFENKEIIRIDSKLVHAEIIKPALSLLTEPVFEKANADFMAAHRHYRALEYKAAVTAANRAFESMLKAICELENWQYANGDRASELITKVRNEGLFTHDFDKSFDAYIAMLKAGLPTIRNNAGGHGEGPETPPVTAEIARFAINMAASNILLLGETYAAFKKASGKEA
jgi:hypothetical protein